MNTYRLPYPPTINHYWRSIGRGRVVISAAGREYRKVVWALALETAQEKLHGALKVVVAVTCPDRRTRDLDNLPKALLDALRYGGAYDDDGFIDDFRIYRAGIGKPGGVIVTVQQFPTPLTQRQVLDTFS